MNAAHASRVYKEHIDNPQKVIRGIALKIHMFLNLLFHTNLQHDERLQFFETANKVKYPAASQHKNIQRRASLRNQKACSAAHPLEPLPRLRITNRTPMKSEGSSSTWQPCNTKTGHPHIRSSNERGACRLDE